MSNDLPATRPGRPHKTYPKSGQSLVDVLVALCVLGLIIPPSIDALGAVFAAEMRIHERERKVSQAEWWFSRLEFPVSQAQIDAAPSTDESGATHFDWETETLPHQYNALRVTLHVSNGTGSDVPFTLIRIY